VILTHRLEQELGALELSQPLQLCYEAVRELLEGGTLGDEALAMARSTDCLFSEHFPDLAAANRLGSWAEAGRLAARSDNRDLLGSPTFGRELRDPRQAGKWDPVVAGRLEEIDALLEAPPRTSICPRWRWRSPRSSTRAEQIEAGMSLASAQEPLLPPPLPLDGAACSAGGR
jgi:hypothetical protein